MPDSGLDEDLDGRGDRSGISSGHGHDCPGVCAGARVQKLGPAWGVQGATSRARTRGEITTPGGDQRGGEAVGRGEQERGAVEAAQRPHWEWRGATTELGGGGGDGDGRARTPVQSSCGHVRWGFLWNLGFSAHTQVCTVSALLSSRQAFQFW